MHNKLHQTIILPVQISSILKKGKYLITFLFLLLCPIFFEGFIIEPSNVPRFLFVNVLFLLVFIRWVYTKCTLSIPTLFLCVTLFVYYAFNVLSASWALNSADALYESQKVFVAFCSLILFYNWLRDKREEKNLVQSLILIALVCLLYAFYQIVHLPNFNLDTLYEVSAFSEHKNLFASLLFLLLTFPLYGILFFKGFWRKLSLLVFIASTSLLFFLQVRSVYLAMFITGFMLGIYFLKRTYSNKRVLLGFLIGFVLLLGLIIRMNSSVFQRLDIRAYASSASGIERIKIWDKTLSLIKEHPLVGVGAGNWQYNFSKYGIGDIENISKNDVSFQRPHNDLLWIIAETGIIGFSLVVLVLAYVFLKSFPAIRKGNTKVVLLFSFLCGLVVESFFSFPKERISHIFLAAIMLSLLFKNLNMSFQVSPKGSGKALLLSTVILYFSISIGLYRLKGEYYTLLMLNEKNNNNPTQVICYGHKAISAFYKTDPTSTPINTYMGWAYSVLNKKDSVLFESEQAYLLAPYDYEVLSNYGLALEKTKDAINAKKILLEALRINPAFEAAMMNLFILEYNAKNYSEALLVLSKIPNYQDRFPVYYNKVMEKINIPKRP